ncbi:CDP-alcohol phosphatidyltransferase family protein [Microvirga vignae]|uniref:CDP-alcohol phosphatidyltransferase family protein n=1 Tax=Microvirga vignae TaxID=1225564 RepID=UPI000B0E7C73
MLDGWVRRRIDPRLNRIGQGLAQAGVSADTTTLLGFGAGLAAAFMLTMRMEVAALFLFALSRVLDGLDGAIARSIGPTDRGGFPRYRLRLRDLRSHSLGLSPCRTLGPMPCLQP